LVAAFHVESDARKSLKDSFHSHNTYNFFLPKSLLYSSHTQLCLWSVADAAKEKTKLSTRARREEKKLQTIVADYNTLLQASADYSPQDLADLEAIIAASRKPDEFQMVDMPFPWLDRVGRQAGKRWVGDGQQE
jgi:hypothetical protein